MGVHRASGGAVQTGRFAVRDTDNDWRRIAASTPYFGVLADKRYLDPTEKDLAEFFRSGDADINHVLKAIRQNFGNFVPRSALDFGCGVGRTLIPIARNVEQAIGIDIAADMRNLAIKHVAHSGVNAKVLETIPEGATFDWVHSFIVFQHIPPVRGYALLGEIWNLVNPGGFMSLQITIFRDHTHVSEIVRDLGSLSYDGERILKYADAEGTRLPGTMSMYDYDLSRILALLNLREGQRLVLEHTNHGGCHGVRMYVQKG
jgi:SAM-dependent methyltransferase